MSSIDPTAISRTRSPDLISGYRLEKLVGTGGMGEVHKATQLSLGRTVAVKLLNAELAKDPSFIARFQKEAAALAALSHPNVVSIVDKGKTDVTYYLVMEFVDGPSLRELIRAPQFDVFGALRRMLEICRAIEYAHGRGVIHRDLKPENILLDQQAGGIAKVSDFGLASFLEDASPSSRYALTSTHVSMGTLSYMAPEQRVDAKNADARADIFSLGVILYEWLTGEVPMGTFDPPSQRKPGLDRRLDAIVTRCLKPDPDDRYPSVTALIADLELLVPGSLPSMLPVKLTRVQRIKAGVSKVVRFTAQAAAVLMVLAASFVLGTAFYLSGERERRERNDERKTPRSPGAAIMELTLKEKTKQSAPSDVQTSPAHRSLTLGEGPDAQSILSTGRAVSFEDKSLVFPWQDDEPVGRVRVDVTNRDGDILSLKARLLAEAPPPTWDRRLGDMMKLYQPLPSPSVAMLLTGTSGRYVALVHNGVGEPLRLEWDLGERRGTMLGMEAPKPKADPVAPGAESPKADPTAPDAESPKVEPVALELTVDAEGRLEAFMGTGKARRVLFEPLVLGTGWVEQFGDAPFPGFGCLDAICRISGITYVVKQSPPGGTTAPVPTPLPPPVKTVAVAVPAKAVVPKKAPPPPPKKQPARPAPKNGKRR
ncbi:serine/threonine-protein kinase [Myxococcus qinghaiensis]|uniref:serine/threonine-protein kinase n=1 Tax=Myxococcus qinghaiensis TaxID=2906758 RepID=UPI0020A7E465|nr:serine/threonine-protein kinase [Myxococcus qinghaiensis]MCP3162824.1 serine/threonine protein kinase [Myxococcus qinghaiensis]